jgi:hypothetical protein
MQRGPWQLFGFAAGGESWIVERCRDACRRRSLATLDVDCLELLCAVKAGGEAGDLAGVARTVARGLRFSVAHLEAMQQPDRAQLGRVVCRLAAAAVAVLRRRAPRTAAPPEDASLAMACVELLAAAGEHVGADEQALATALDAPIDPPHLLHLEAWAEALRSLAMVTTPEYVDAAMTVSGVVLAVARRLGARDDAECPLADAVVCRHACPGGPPTAPRCCSCWWTKPSWRAWWAKTSTNSPGSPCTPPPRRPAC